MPDFVAAKNRADFLAGWAAGQAAAAAGPLPDEIARDVVLILDTTNSSLAMPRPASDGVRDAG